MLSSAAMCAHSIIINCTNLSMFLLTDVVVHALDTTWELHKPYLQKSTLLMSLLKRAEMTGMRNIEEEKEELPKPGETGMEQVLRVRIRGNRDSVVVRMPHHHHHVLPRSGQALASHQRVPSLIPGSCMTYSRRGTSRKIW